MAERLQGKNRKRKHFEIEKTRHSPFQNPSYTTEPASVMFKAPRGINAAEFAEARALEIHNMMTALSTASQHSNKRVFQSLPRHMRRRAASHNSKRMPARLRDAYNREDLKTKLKQKDPLSKPKKSRRQCRKPSNLLAEYSRRKKKHAWLETHIWHAKRFKMIEQWGYKIPLHPNDKSVRASYRAMANGCLLQDISYYQCIEVCGEQEMILEAMKHITSSDIGLTTAAKDYLSGRLEGHVMLYKYDQYPNQAIGPVTVLWQQQVDISLATATRRLWVWSHPACSGAVTTEIINSCSREGITDVVTSKPWSSKETSKGTDSTDTSRNTSSGEAAKFAVTVLHEQLIRLRLTGPKSHALLAATFEPCEWSTVSKRDDKRWWHVYTQNKDMSKTMDEQNRAWEQMKRVTTPAVLQEGSVFALVVKDPRLGLPVRKSSVDMASRELYTDGNVEDVTFPNVPECSAISPLWDPSIREEVKQTKLPEKDVNKLRSNQAVPGSILHLGDQTSRIPMLVIQQPGNTGNYQMRSVNFGSGYDVIFPAGWSMAFWVAFVYRGARVGGARELATCSREKGMPHFPCDFPDTPAGREFNEEQKRNGEGQYERYPPAKRRNYVKLGIASPFGPDWDTLVREWSDEVDRLEEDNAGKVVESAAQSEKGKTHEELTRKDIQSRRTGNVTTSNKSKLVGDVDQLSLGESQLKRVQDVGQVNDDRETTVEAEDDEFSNMKQRMDMNADEQRDRGSLQEQTKRVDTWNDNEKPRYHGGSGTKEDCKIDLNTPTVKFNVIRSLSNRKRLQDIVLSLTLSTTRRPQKMPVEGIIKYLTKTIKIYHHSLICVNLRPLMKGCPQENAVIYMPTTQDLIQLQQNRGYGGPVEHVHKCSNPSSMIGQCSRKAIGRVTSGQFSFVRGQGSAIGFCAFPAFCELITRAVQEKQSPVVLVRNTSTFQYRFADIIVV